jgi:hypothetical protein
MAVIDINDGIIECISILTADIHPMMKFDVDKPRDSLSHEITWVLAIVYQWSNRSALDFDRGHHLPHGQLQEKILIIGQKRMNEFQTLSSRFEAVEIILLCNVVSCQLNKMGFNPIDLCSNLVPVWACNIQPWPLLVHTSFNISFVPVMNSMVHILCCSIAVFLSVSINCQCGAAGQAFAMHHVASLAISKSLALINGRLLHMLSSKSLPNAHSRRIMSE